MRSFRLFVWFLMFLWAVPMLPGCATTSSMPASQAEFRLFVDVTPKDARIFVDDELTGSALHTAERPLSLQAGTRRIFIVRDGYHPFRTTLEYIQPGEVYTLKTHLIASEF